MSIHIAGMGWVTPLGSGVSAVWQRLLAGEQATAETLTSPQHGRSYPVFRVPAAATAAAPMHPRLRRSSAISRFAVVAGLAALEDAGVSLDSAQAERAAIIFAISNGGVVYTKRFYHDVVESGAQAASPLLFPETVFNAPASHLAAILGITGASYTLVGDGAVGLLALQMAEDLMLNPQIDRCLVVGAEEADWLLCDAYRRWRLLRNAPPLEPFQNPARGTILSEGAGALLLERSGATVVDGIEAGANFRRQRDAAAGVAGALQRLHATNEDLIVASANGTFVDEAEACAMRAHCPSAAVYAPKAALGESVGASGLWQVICAAQALRTGALPPSLHPRPDRQVRRAIVSTCGMNQQVAGLALSRAR
ncbi:MAG: beta-ketoacyl synthase N-terminal-like domain-containing protein [Chthoniobacterales bacterium]